MSSTCTTPCGATPWMDTPPAPPCLVGCPTATATATGTANPGRTASSLQRLPQQCPPCEVMIVGERFNSISHLVGAVLAVGGAAMLITLSSLRGDPWRIVGFSVYGAMLVALYVASTLYHALGGRAKAVFQKLDHCSIYLLIAGSYTPFAL